LRPVHTHLREEKLRPGEAVALDVEIWPTSMVVPKGYRLMLTLAGRDFELPGKPGRILHQTLASVGAQAAVQSIFTGGATPSYLLLPLIPSEV
jgi:predicted acyl esterase